MAHAFDNRHIPREIDERLYSNNSSRHYEKSDPEENYPIMSNQQQFDSSFHQRQRAIIDDYHSYVRQNSPVENKPPSTIRMPRMTSITNDNYIRRTNQFENDTKYLSAAQLYIQQPADDQPPPPPPRCPINSSRYPIKSTQTNSVTIPDFNSSNSPKTIYRSSPSSSIERQFQSLSLDNQYSIDETTTESIVGESFGNCSKCGEIITSSDDPCDLLGQTYHGFCAICFVCKQSVKNRHFYIHDQLYCEEDFKKLNCKQSTDYCVVCHRLINDMIIQALGESYHFSCFHCSKCSMYLDGKPFLRDKNRNLLCLRDYYAIYGLKCDKCKKTIYPENDSNETVRIVSMGKNFHPKCYQCEDCSKQLGDEQDRLCYPMDDALLCQDCCQQRLVYTNKF